MNKASVAVIAFLFLGLGLFLVYPVFAAEQKVTFSADGKKMIFPDKDGIPDADIAGITLNLTDVPPEAQFMVGKIYRGVFTNPKYRQPVGIGYTFLMKWNKDTMELFLSKTRSASPAGHSAVSCLPTFAPDFSCVHKSLAEKSPALPYAFRFSIKKGKPLLEISDGTEIEFQEVGVLPDTIAHK
jgi:hypothetical protein